jgi:hypothetical protein
MSTATVDVRAAFCKRPERASASASTCDIMSSEEGLSLASAAFRFMSSTSPCKKAMKYRTSGTRLRGCRRCCRTDSEPSITADGLEIFFHSNRTGRAGIDMYSSVRNSVLEPWSEPKQLGTVVNTAANDGLGAISPDGETLFFTSTRDGGLGSNDIYVTTRTKHGKR